MRLKEALFLALLSHAQSTSLGTSKDKEVEKIPLSPSGLQPQTLYRCGPNVSSKQIARYCPSNLDCDKLALECLTCTCSSDCAYGKNYTAVCFPSAGVECLGNQTVTRDYSCRYCFQTNPAEHLCTDSFGCDSVADPTRQYFITNCTVPNEVLCLGRREFLRQQRCNWTGGYKWTTALALSITLGGFGADRFYLGHWQEGIGKLFSFGGLGVWTLVDVVMVVIRYVGPADGSLYI